MRKETEIIEEAKNMLIDGCGNLGGESADVSFDDIQLNGVDGLNKVEDSEQYVKKEDVSKAFDDPEQRKKFIKNLNPKVKAGLVFEMLSRAGQIRVFGHEKRIYLRKLEREAAKGRLDYLFEEKREEKRDK